MRVLGFFALLAVGFVSIARTQTAPTIASISNSQLLTQGQSATLSVSVNGTTPFTYQWNKDGNAISGANSNSYTIASVALSDAGSYAVVVANSAGSVTGGPILLDVTPATPPSFNYQPSNLSYYAGDTINFYASVSGTSPMTFVWKKDGTTIATTSSYSYSISNAQASNAGSYTVTVSNAVGSVTSSAFTVQIKSLTAPALNYNVNDQNVTVGDTIQLWSSFSGPGNITYQWYKDGTAIPGATSYYYYKSGAVASDAGNYTVTATNAAGSTTSNAAKVTVNPARAPSGLSLSTSSIVIPVGGSGSFYVNVSSGTSPFSYQWKKDGVAIAGATSSSYGINSASAADTGNYTVVVSNSAGSATSTSFVNVAVSAALPPIIVVQPASRAVFPGSSITLSVSVGGTSPFTYQWKKDGVAVSGATSSYYYVTWSAAASDAGSYTVDVTNIQGTVTSMAAKVTILDSTAPTITTQPSDVSVLQGGNISFSVTADGQPSPQYQWYKDGVAITGATNSYYGRSPAASSDAGVYSVIVSNSAGSVTSRDATATVTAATLPVIVQQPASYRSVTLSDYDYGSTLSVSLAQNQYDTYQWYKNGTAVTGATSPTYYFGSVQPSLAGTYHVVVTNTAGSVTSDDCVITVDLKSDQPAITYVPGARLIPGGNSYAGFGVQVASWVPSGYTVVWKKDGVVIPGTGNSTSFSINYMNTAAVGKYVAVITSGTNTYTSPEIPVDLLNKGMAPSVTSAPVSATVATGGSASFSVYAVGELPFTYQWYKDGVAIPNATSSSYYISNATSDYAGSYKVDVTNRVGTTTSSAAALIVNTAAGGGTGLHAGLPVITSQPSSLVLNSGYYGSTQLSVSVLYTYSDPFTYQWYKNGVAIANATSYYLYLNGNSSDAGRYKVVVTNGAGSTTSDEAVVTYSAPAAAGPSVSNQPAAATTYLGLGANFTVTANGASTLSYQWRKDGVAITGATSATYSIAAAQAADAGNYSVLVSDLEGSVSSNVAALTVLPGVAPTISTQPAAQYVVKLSATQFAVTATGGPAPTYQWQKDGVAIAGATDSTYRLASVSAADAGVYCVVVSNPFGTVTSTGAALKVYDQAPSAPTITAQSASHTYGPREAVSLSVTVGGYPAAQIQWYKNGAPIDGATGSTLSLKMSAAAVGDYTAVASNDLGSVTSNIITLALGPSPYAGTYFGGMDSGGGHWALVVNTDGTGTLLAYLPGRNSAVKTDVVVEGDGTFYVTGTEIVPTAIGAAETALSAGDTRKHAVSAASFTLFGQITAGALSAQFSEFGLKLTGSADTGTGATRTYSATALGTSSGTTYAIVASSGQALVVTTTAAGIDGATGTLDSTGKLAATTAGGSQLTMTVDASGGSIAASITPSGSSTPVSYAGLGDDVAASKRLVNISSRANSGTGNNVAIGGFVIGGSGTKRVLIRAVGPTLNSQGIPVGEQMADPTIVLHDILHGSTVIANADNWNDGTGGPAITALAAQVGAATLSGSDATSAAAILDLAPGVYSFVAAGKNQTTGIVLTEVYDADPTTSSATLSNISTRANCAQGDSVAIGGFVVAGNAPKTVLVRAVGPTLTTQGLSASEVLHDPTVEVHDVLHGQKVIATNDNWTDNANSAAITTAAARLGATPLDQSDTTSSAMLLTLNPGVYSFVVNGKNNTSGIVLIEVYDAD